MKSNFRAIYDTVVNLFIVLLKSSFGGVSKDFSIIFQLSGHVAHLKSACLIQFHLYIVGKAKCD